MASNRSSSGNDNAKSKENDQAHIPFSLRDPVLQMTSVAAYTGNLPTIFVGVVDEDYTDEMWENHTTRIMHLFSVESSFIGNIKVGEGSSKLYINADQMGLDVSMAIKIINDTQKEQEQPLKALRIVGIGIKSAIGVHIAMEALIKGWDQQWDQKSVQFIALGDTEQGHYLNFCKSLCLKRICATVQFYSTKDYNQFGYFWDNQINPLKLMRGLPADGKEDIAKLISKLLAGEEEANIDKK